MIKKNTLLTILFFVYSFNASFSQSFWKKAKLNNDFTQQKGVLYKKNFPKKYTIMSLELNNFNNHLRQKSKSTNNYIQLPNANGDLKKFKVKETSYLASKLAAKFPIIKSYSAQGIDDPTATAKVSFGTDGMHVIIFSGKNSTIYIDPYSQDKQEYIVYKRSDLNKSIEDLQCEIESNIKQIKETSSFSKRNANDGKLRSYRLAVVTTGEYSQFHINRQGVSGGTDQEKKATVISAINTTMTRVNGVFERDLGVNMILVSDNDKIIFLDASTDDLSNSNASNLINESQTKCDDLIGEANYDIGHAFSTGGGGLAQLNSVCSNGSKARGITGSSQPVNDPYDIDFVAHEIGHQFGATHTQNNDCQRSSVTSVEPGSASTIMGYAGICSPNVQNNSDDHFHAVSIAQMWSHVQNGGGCATETNTGNNAPTANAGNDYNIPKSTPFILKGSATDADGTAGLTYNWEQIDNEVGTMPPLATNTAGPMFRSLSSKDSPNRYMPQLSTVIAGNTSTTWEVLPSVAREMNFALTVRDNNTGGGNTARDDMKVTVIDTEAFTVTSQNSTETYNTGTTQTITWNKGTTDQAPINSSLVNIKLSTDGGLTFPITLKENTPNDGTENIVIPNNPTTTARIMIEAADNIFYNVNSSNFTINSTVPTFILTNTSENQETCNTGNNSVTYNLNLDFVNGFSENVTFSSTGQPSGSTVTFSPTSISSDGTVQVTISDLDGANQQDYTIVIEANSNTVTQTTDAFLKVLGANFNNIALTNPTNGTNNVSITPNFQWGADNNATAYDIFVATDNSFSNVIISESVNTNSFIPSVPLQGLTKYYWYVKPKNNCGEGGNSSIGEFTTEEPEYCSSTFTDEAGGTEHITNVTFNTINNNSNNDTVDGYQDFTSINTNIRRTESHQISVTFDTGGYQDHCYVFIDWNKDFQFDKDTERYDLGTKSDADGNTSTTNADTATFNITVPNNAVLGETRMRVIIEYDDPSNGFGDGPCDSDHLTEWGETEDYTLIIEEAPQPDFTLTNTTGNISICNQGVTEQVFKVNYEALFGFNENVNFTVSQVPTNASVNLSSTSLNTNGTIDITVSDLNNVANGDYTLQLTGTSSITKSIELRLVVNDNVCIANGNTASQISTTNVTFSDINNTSTKTTGYSDFKTISTEVIKGQSYSLNTSVNTDGNNTVKTYAWIDWNQNCVFDTNEQYDLGTLANGTGTTSNSALEITIPNNALIGNTVLRVITKNSTNGDPMSCELDFDGEVEDYTINITPTFTLTSDNIGGSICKNAVSQFVYTLDYETLNDFNEQVNLTVENAPTNSNVALSTNSINSNGEFTVTISNLDNVANGEYAFTIRATSNSIEKEITLIINVNDNLCKSYGNTDSNISITNVVFNTIDNTSTKENGFSNFTNISTTVARGDQQTLAISLNNGGVAVNTTAWVDWNQNCVFDANERFDLGSDNSTIISVPEEAILGNTTMRVSTKNATNGSLNSCELDFDGEVEDYTIIVEEAFATDNTLFKDLNLYPIPSDGNITVDFRVKDKDLIIVNLFNTRGQLVSSQNFSTTTSLFRREVEFNVRSGLYLLQVQNAGRQLTKKVIIR